MIEKELLEEVRKLATLYHWKFYHTWNSIHSAKGFPDIVMANSEQGRVVYAELKSMHGKVSIEQQEWLDTLRACGQEAYVFYPNQIEDIARILQASGEID